MTPDGSMQAVRFEEALLSLDRGQVRAALAEWAQRGPSGRIDLADQVIAPALVSIGRGWDEGSVALSQVYMAGRLIEEALEQVFPRALPRPGAPRIGVGVLEDQHGLGKRIVCAVLGAGGYDVRDLGCGLDPVAMVDRSRTEKVDVLMISVLMLNRALHVSRVREEMTSQGLGHVTLAVGGAPFLHNPDLYRRVGADYCGRSAADALLIAGACTGGAR